jgi:hypothetical protein
MVSHTDTPQHDPLETIGEALGRGIAKAHADKRVDDINLQIHQAAAHLLQKATPEQMAKYNAGIQRGLTAHESDSVRKPLEKEAAALADTADATSPEVKKTVAASAASTEKAKDAHAPHDDKNEKKEYPSSWHWAYDKWHHRAPISHALGKIWDQTVTWNGSILIPTTWPAKTIWLIKETFKLGDRSTKSIRSGVHKTGKAISENPGRTILGAIGGTFYAPGAGTIVGAGIGAHSKKGSDASHDSHGDHDHGH